MRGRFSVILTPLVPTTTHRPRSARVADDLEDVAAQQRLAAREDRQALGGEGGDLVDDLEALLGVELAAVGEGLGADRGLRPASR